MRASWPAEPTVFVRIGAFHLPRSAVLSDLRLRLGGDLLQCHHLAWAYNVPVLMRAGLLGCKHAIGRELVQQVDALVQFGAIEGQGRGSGKGRPRGRRRWTAHSPQKR